ncbi:MAG TPA: hypothetical protein VES20_19360 [Bryobacteraceae bacterium]|nr:hypothetical protein [Bryobacteraceae bacterium]
MPEPPEPVSGKRECKADSTLDRTGQMSAIWVGIDVSKRCLDVAIRPAGETLSLDNDDAGIRKLVRALAKWSPQLIVLERPVVTSMRRLTRS